MEILNSVKDLVPASVFTTEYKNPVNGDTTKLRQSLRTANEILTKAGYTLNGNQLVEPSGTPVSFEDPAQRGPPSSRSPRRSRPISSGSASTPPSARWIRRNISSGPRTRDYDMIYTGWVQSLSPATSSAISGARPRRRRTTAATMPAFSDKGVDALIDKIVFADDRETLIAATRALDRVLLAHHYTVPTYTLRKSRIARWDRFSHPKPCRNSRSASRRCGGTTKPRRPRPGRRRTSAYCRQTAPPILPHEGGGAASSDWHPRGHKLDSSPPPSWGGGEGAVPLSQLSRRSNHPIPLFAASSTASS